MRFANRILQLWDVAQGVEESLVILQQLSEEEGFANARLADDNQVALYGPQLFEFDFAPNERNRWRRSSVNRDAG